MPRTATTVGLHGHELLGLLYRYGTLTRIQIERLTGLHYAIAKRQLGYLVSSGYVLETRDVAGWVCRSAGRPPTAYYLSLPLGAKTGAFILGIENDVMALKHYRRVRLPGTTSHRLLGNEYLILNIEAAGDALDAGETHSESCSDFPLFGTGTAKSDRADTRYQFARVVPDGIFSFNGNTYLLEVETGTRARAELVKKLSDYAGRWRRMLKPNSGERKYHDQHARLEPVVILTSTDEHKGMRDYLRKNLPETGDWQAGDAAIKAASGNTAEAGQLVMVSGIDEVRDDPLGRHYRPLFRYPKELSNPAPGGIEGWRVSLQDAAAISERITVPEKPPKFGTKSKDTKGAA